MRRRRRSIYRLPRLRLKHKAIAAVASLVSIILAVLSTVALTTDTTILSFWRRFLYSLLGWTSIFSPVLFLLSSLVLSRARWRIAQTNVLLGTLLLVLSLSGVTGAFKMDLAGLIGLNF